MPINPGDSFNQALELFSSLYQDCDPTDLCSGLSPGNSDVSFLPGSVFTRPALQRLLSSQADTGSKLSLTEYANPNGDYLKIWLSSTGKLWQQDNATLVTSEVGEVVVTPGSQFRSVTAFQKQWFAFFNQAASGISDAPYFGFDVPRYYDGQNVWRVTQDAPGAPPSFANVPTVPVTLVQSSVSGTITITAVKSIDPRIVTIPNHIPGGDPIMETFYGQLLYTCTTSPPFSWAGSQVTVTGCTGANASLANVTGIIASVGTDQFVLAVGTGLTLVNLTGQSATGTVSGNYFIRSENIVTAYTGSVSPANFAPGLYVQILNSNGTQINGPNWTITSIARDATGLVTVTISTQLTNLPSGATLYINASDTTDFPAGFQEVYQVISATGGSTTFTISDPTWGNGAVVSSSGGSVYQQWSGSFQMLSLGIDSNGDNFTTYFQLGPDTNLGSDATGTPQATIQAQIPPGPRSAVLIFQSVNGAQTAPSIPIQLTVNGGTNLLNASNILIGPPGTAKRIIAFTPAYGSSYFYITPSYIPSAAGLSPVLSLGTVINDNTTISLTLDFSDAQLTAGTEIDVQGNDLFNQVVLAPCLGCIEYEGRMDWWGELNDIKNLINGHFDGGYAPIGGIVNTGGMQATLQSGTPWVNAYGVSVAIGSVIYINGLPFTIASVTNGTILNVSAPLGTQLGVPFYILSPNGNLNIPGWNNVNASYLITQTDQSLGFAVQMATASGVHAKISQPCNQDYYGAPIVQPNTPYLFRCLAACALGFGSTVPIVTVALYSPSLGTLSSGSGTPSTQGWIAISLPAISTVPPDLELTIDFVTDPSSETTSFLTIDEVETINALQPVLFQQMRISYFNNPFGYDEETGILGLDGSAKITAAFKQRSYLYALTDGPLYQTQNNGSTEPDGWSFTDFADACDCFGPNAVDTTEDIAWWAGRSGLRLFSGSQPKKISQEIQPSWETINQNAPLGVWLADDPIERIVYIGIPTGNSLLPTKMLPMSYRSVDAVYNVPDPLHTSYSGKMIATDLCRKWTQWNLPMCCACLLTMPGSQIFFGGPEQAFAGNLYELNASKYTDDDFGQIFSYYTTYFFFNHDTESQAPGLGLHQKIYPYLTAYITGVGQIQPTALVNNLNNPWQTVATVWDETYQIWATSGSPANPIPAYPLTNGVLINDLEWGLNINSGARMAIKWAALPLPGQTDAAFRLTHMVLSGRANILPVRGALG